MCEDHQHEQHPEAYRRHSEEIDLYELADVVSQEQINPAIGSAFAEKRE